MPHGAMGELIPALEALKYAHVPTQIVLGLRDILDVKAVIARRWAIEGAYQTIEQYYDRVLVYGMQDVYDIAKQYNFPTPIGRSAAILRVRLHAADGEECLDKSGNALLPGHGKAPA